MPKEHWPVRNIIVSLLLVCLAVAIAGCNMETATVIKADSSGTVTTTINLTAEEMKGLRELPNFNEYMTSWGEGLARTGQNKVEIKESSIIIQRKFKNVEELNKQENSQQKGKTWVFVKKQKEPFGYSYKYVANIDTWDLYAKEGIIANNSQIRDEVYKNLDAVPMTFTLTMPGEVKYSNSSGMNPRQLVWRAGMNKVTRITAESEVIDGKTLLLYRIGAWTVVVVTAGSLLLIIFSIFFYRRGRLQRKGEVPGVQKNRTRRNTITLLITLSCLVLLFSMGQSCITGGDTPEKRQAVSTEAGLYGEFLVSIKASDPSVVPPPWIVEPGSGAIIDKTTISVLGFAILSKDRPRLFNGSETSEVYIYRADENQPDTFVEIGLVSVDYNRQWRLEALQLSKGKNIIGARVKIGNRESEMMKVEINCTAGNPPAGERTVVITNKSRLQNKISGPEFSTIDGLAKGIGEVIYIDDSMNTYNWQDVDKWIEQQYLQKPISTLLILGNDDIIPYAVYKNPVKGMNEDTDETILTDDEYADLDHDKRRIVDIPVARIPSDDFNVLKTQLSKPKNIKQGDFALINKERPYAARVTDAYSGHTLRWSDPTRIGDYSKDRVNVKYDYFLLHGRKTGVNWMGEGVGRLGSTTYPVAFSIEYANSAGYVCTGACYGAYTIDRSSSDSIAIRFLENGSRAFVGSTAANFSTNESISFFSLYYSYLAKKEEPLDAFFKAKRDYGKKGLTNLLDLKNLHQYVFFGRP